jgi:hypothetical protein
MKHSMNSADLQPAGFLIQSRDSIESVVRQPRGAEEPQMEHSVRSSKFRDVHLSTFLLF